MNSQRPIRIKPHVTESGKRGWRWTCSDHPNHRGHHQLERWTDWVRERKGDPDDHAFVRCMRGASEHWHKLHAPEHHCCPIAYREAAMTADVKYCSHKLCPLSVYGRHPKTAGCP